MGIGAVIGSGIYTLPSLLASVAGLLSFVAVVVMGIVTLLLMFIMAKLGVQYPKAGAIYYFSREILGDLNGFITGLCFYACCFVGTAAIIYAFILYLNYYIPGLAVGYTLTLSGTAISLVILAVVTFVNILGVKYGAGLNFVLVIVKIIPLVVFILFAFTRFNPANFIDFAPFGLSAMGLALAFVLDVCRLRGSSSRRRRD
ncbi:MAG: APC family permease [Sulfolobales archaeon]